MHNSEQNLRDRNRCLEIIIRVLETLDSAIALSVAISIRYNCVYQNTTDPRNYDNPSKFFDDSQAIALVRKNPWVYRIDPDILAKKSLDNFLNAEATCKFSNHRFRHRIFNFEDRSLLERARTYCSMILGEFEYGALDFGPGSTRALAGQDANIISKLVNVPDCTPECHLELTRVILEQIPHYAISYGLVRRDRGAVSIQATETKYFPGNQFSTVPKDCRSDRPICIEPTGNMLLQKAIGSSIRSRLRKYGLDLNSCPDRHSIWVREGSRDGGISTIDLSSASDTISRELVRFLIPEEWFDKMSLCRSRYTLLPNGDHLFNEKFSSMGNGYTFELESLIFYSLMLATRAKYGSKSDIVSVFGDDIIISTPLYQHAVSILETCGFSINIEKSFTDDVLFRESCGHDFFNGINVRPVYIKELSNEIQLHNMANRVREIAYRRTNLCGCDSSFRDLWSDIIKWIPSSLRLIGPAFYGDDVISATCDEWTNTVIVDGCLRVKVFRHSPRRRKRLPGLADKALACVLYGVPSSGVVPRGAKTTLRTRYAPAFKGEGSHLTWI